MLGSPDNGVPVLKTDDARRRRLIMPLFIAALAALLVLGLVWNRGQDSQIRGAGSTLAAPLIDRSAITYRNAFSADNPERPDQTGGDWVMDGSGFSYEPVGSLGGIMRLDDPEVDFAVSDYPLTLDTIDSKKLGQFPIAAGSIALVHDLDLGGKPLKLDAQIVANIYLGKITSWNDKQLAALNPGVTLPNLPITPVHRSDGSGSTEGLTKWLTREVPAWKDGPGSGAQITWPEGVGKAEERSGGVIGLVKQTKGALTYAEPGQAKSAGLQVAQVRNGADEFIAPDAAGMAAALKGTDWASTDHFTKLAAKPDAKGAYPLTVPIYVALKREPQQKTDGKRSLAYLMYVINKFDSSASKLGYLPLPAEGAAEVSKYVAETFPHAPATN
ncbi:MULTISPECIES: phosphate ABC transporter substrate-binding protein PstS [unclassified Luteococcus]|uniref:phosphate ABC transporter substrate-binding protein PstS n=1 Tax=unclassified Luteococcus TaxID=2639923 RepID=UPI00313BE711